ncbi:hypothetical protein R1flu_009684 [Riccia fluitans]|uniref:YDG domain-containing protein n=1 Tax=Riccia fluitans TaxID=41844 RepID=A0ABD1Z5U2_9MARC
MAGLLHSKGITSHRYSADLHCYKGGRDVDNRAHIQSTLRPESETSGVCKRLDHRSAAIDCRLEGGEIESKSSERDGKRRPALLSDTWESRESFNSGTSLPTTGGKSTRHLPDSITSLFTSCGKVTRSLSPTTSYREKIRLLQPRLDHKAEGRAQEVGEKSQGTSLNPATFDWEEIQLLLRHLETTLQGVTATCFEDKCAADDEELEEGEINPDYSELEEGELDPDNSELEEGEIDASFSRPDEIRTEAFLPPSAERKENYVDGKKERESQGGVHSSSSQRIDDGAELKRVKEEPEDLEMKRVKGKPLDTEEHEDVEVKYVKERSLDAKKEKQNDGGFSLGSLRIDEGAIMNPVKEESVDEVPPQPIVTETVRTSDTRLLNFPMFDREEESDGEGFSHSGKEQERLREKFGERPEEPSHTSTPKSSAVADTLQIFEALVNHFQFDAKDSRRTSGRQPAIMRAAGVMNENNLILPGDIIGQIEGIEVGRRFSSRGEMSVLGLHRELLGGINVVVMKDSADGVETRIGTSIVFGLGDDYPDNKFGLGENDLSIYSGEGGSPSRKERDRNKVKITKGLDGSLKYTDQKLTGGNLALRKSFERKIPTRVIKGLKKGPDNMDNKKYVYDSMYQIQEVRFERGVRGNNVFKFFISRVLWLQRSVVVWLVFLNRHRVKLKETM